MLPLAVVSPLAGVFVDKWNVKCDDDRERLVARVTVMALIFVPT